AHPAPLRSAGLLLPPGPLFSPVVVHSYGVSDDPGGIRSSSGSAALRRAATPPWTPLVFSSRRPRQAQAGASWLGTQSAKLAAGGGNGRSFSTTRYSWRANARPAIR